ncbi:MAG TPA: GspH/FimT family pseudopilin [Burkholderiaceae bacterium]
MKRQRGLSLIELMIAIAIVAIALAVGAPSFSQWIQNAQNRAAAESVLNGIQLARAEAVRRNAAVRFDLTDATGLVSWTVGCVNVTADCPAEIQAKAAAEGGANARAGVSTATIPVPAPAGHFGTAIAAGTALPAGVTFNGLGRVLARNIGDDITRVDLTNSTGSGFRRFVVVVGTGGQIRMCDPALSFSANSQGCS